MSPNPSPDARMAVIEDRLDRLEKKRDQSDEKSDEISKQLAEIKGDLKWLRIIGGAIVAAYTGIFLWFIFSYIPEKLTDRIPSVLREKLTKLEANVSILQDQIKRLTPSSLKQLIPEPDRVTDVNIALANLRKASTLIDVALTTEIPADPKLLSPLRSQTEDFLNKNSANPELRKAAAATTVRLEGYEIASDQLLSGLKPQTQPPSNPANVGPSVYFAGFSLNCTNPVADFLGIYPPYKPEQVLVFNVRVDTCGQKIDGIKWIEDTFTGSRIEYHGGSLRLAGVRFINCNFKFGNDPKSIMALAEIKGHGDSPVDLFIP